MADSCAPCSWLTVRPVRRTFAEPYSVHMIPASTPQQLFEREVNLSSHTKVAQHKITAQWETLFNSYQNADM